MIEGLQIQVKGEELKEIILARADFHGEKAEWYTKQMNEFKKAHEALPTEMQNTSNSPIDGMERKVKDHTDKAAYFRFLADHLATADVYQLTERDLGTLEVSSRYF